MGFALLKSFAKSLLKVGVNALVGGLPLGGLLLEIAADTMTDWEKQQEETERLAELQARF
jgi:hypothetical protein